MTSAATRCAAEDRLSGTIGLVNMPTRRAATRGVARIDQHHGDADPLSLVADKGTKLRKRPAMQLSALLPPSPHPRAHAFEVFKADRPFCAFGSLNEVFADRMVGVFGEAGFLARQAPEPSLGRQRAFLLEPVAQATMPVPHVLDRAAAVDRAVRVRRDVGDAQVNAKHIVYVLGIGFLHLARDQQIPRAPVEQQVAFTLACGEHLTLPLATDKRNGRSPAQSPDRYLRWRKGERENAVIVGNTGKRAKRALCFLVQFVGVSNFGKRPHGHLCRQPEPLAYLRVARLLERKLAKRARFPRNIADEVARGVGRLKRAPEEIGLFGRRLQLQLCNQLHTLNYSTYERCAQEDGPCSRRLEVWCESSLRRAFHSSARAKARRHPERVNW